MKFINQAVKYRVIRLPDVKAITSLSRSAIYDRISKGTFPKQISLGGRAIGFLESDVQKWIEQRVAASRAEG